MNKMNKCYGSYRGTCGEQRRSDAARTDSNNHSRGERADAVDMGDALGAGRWQADGGFRGAAGRFRRVDSVRGGRRRPASVDPWLVGGELRLKCRRLRSLVFQASPTSFCRARSRTRL
jgi:hypothetical protein